MENIDVMVWLWVPKVQIDEQPTIVHHNHIVHAIHLCLPINRFYWVRLFENLRILMKVSSMNPMQP
jgi:hypothetical protein